MGVEVDCPFTPAMLRKVAYAGSQSTSFVQASNDLEALAETAVSRERVQRWTKRVGRERVREAEALARAYQEMPLPEQQKSPTGQAPQVACVMVDGGRIQMRRRDDSLEAQEEKSKGYLQHQRSRMKYDQYRKLGLPITSSHIESTIKQINRRVKGTEKFWDQGAEPLLQLAADHLSETTDLERFWTRRRQSLPPMRSYHAAA